MISSSWKFSMTPDQSLARISSRICSTLGASPEPSVRWRGTRKSRMRRPSWYLTVRNARFRPNIPTVLWSALMAMKLTAGLRLDNIVWKRLSKRLSCWIWKFSFPARPGSKTLLVCLGSLAVLRTALRHSTFILSASVVPSCQAWQPYQAVQYVWSKLNFTSLCTVEKTEFNRLTAAIKCMRDSVARDRRVIIGWTLSWSAGPVQSCLCSLSHSHVTRDFSATPCESLHWAI